MLDIIMFLDISDILIPQDTSIIRHHIKILLKILKRINKTHGETKPKPVNEIQASYKAITTISIHRKHKPIMIKVQDLV